MAQQLSFEKLAPELGASRRHRLLVILSALAVFGLAATGMFLGFVFKANDTGVSQLNYFSTEPFLTAPGARVVYYPEKHTAIVKGWLMPPLNGAGVYQVWALRDGRYQSIGMDDSLPFVDLTLIVNVDLDGVDSIIVTREPPGGSVTPGTLLATLVPRP